MPDESLVSGNGHGTPSDMLDADEIKAYMDLKDRQRGDSSIAEMGKVAQGVIASTLSFPDHNINQQLLLSDIESYEERDDVLAAIREHTQCGVSLMDIEAYLAASSATHKRVRLNNRVNAALSAINHTTFTTNVRPASGRGSNRNSISD